MKIYDYDELAELSYDQIKAIASLRENFYVKAKLDAGKKICAFLENENCFRHKRKNLLIRIKYFIKGMSFIGISSGFVPIWNACLMEGYQVESFLKDKDYYFTFTIKA
ncbi:MAG: hypothetical protein IM445_00285 [Microcystis sp. M015S1]|jgi:hypothetical protein|nr:hypothetical protein [Microcystis sp. M015S1]MCA3169968.1 hypothetical protein [Burkholderiales bacterium]MCA3173896.1 hypothetical protein [Burkholderiales bacterium]